VRTLGRSGDGVHKLSSAQEVNTRGYFENYKNDHQLPLNNNPFIHIEAQDTAENKTSPKKARNVPCRPLNKAAKKLSGLTNAIGE